MGSVSQETCTAGDATRGGLDKAKERSGRGDALYCKRLGGPSNYYGFHEEGALQTKQTNLIFLLFCTSRMPCVERELAQLHELSTATSEMRAQSIDRYLYICALLDTADVARVGRRDEPCPSVRRIALCCFCGDPSHTVVLDKKRVSGACFPLDARHQNKPKTVTVRVSNRWMSVKKGRTGARVPARFLVPDEEEALQFEVLPDLGMYIRCLLVRRFFTSGPVKHFRRCARLLLGVDAAEAHSAKSGDGLTPIAFSERFVDGFCCMLLQESIPCMKRAKRSIKVTEFDGKPTPVEMAACINVLHGTLLSLYPRAAKRPTFGVRVRLAWRLRQLLCTGVSDQLQFFEEHGHLVKICFMEYVNNVVLQYMPAEKELLFQTPSMKLYQTVCSTMCDSFRTDALKTGDETWAAMNQLAGVCIDRCLRMCKFKMHRWQEPMVKLQPNTLVHVKEALDLPCTYGCISMLRHVTPVGISEAVLRCALLLQNGLQTFPLPKCVMQAQMRTVARLHGRCFRRSFAACHTHVCCVCALAGKGIQTPMRFCSETGEVSCVYCKPGTVVSGGLQGRAVVEHLPRPWV